MGEILAMGAESSGRFLLAKFSEAAILVDREVASISEFEGTLEQKD